MSVHCVTAIHSPLIAKLESKYTQALMGKSQVSFDIQIVHTTDTWCIGGNSTWGPHCNTQALWWEKVRWVFDTFCTRQTRGAREVIAPSVHIAMQAVL